MAGQACSGRDEVKRNPALPAACGPKAAGHVGGMIRAALVLAGLALLPFTPASAATPPPKAVPAPAAKIEGQEIARPGKGFLGLRIEEGTFRLAFYDEARKPVPADVSRAVLRWDPSYKIGKERVVLTPGGEPNLLTSPRNIRPPYQFRLTLTLLRDGAAGDEAGEVIVVDFRQ